MNLFKKLALLSVATFCLSAGAQAQLDVKFNFLGFLFNQYQVGGEYVLSEEMSTGAFASYSIWNFETTRTSYDANGNLVTEVDELTLSGLSVIPNVRFYFNPDDDCDGYFAEGYLKWRQRKATNQNLEYSEYVAEPNAFGGVDYTLYEYDYDYDVTQSATALGVGFGRKWMTNVGFFAESFIGIGKNLIENTKYSEDAVTEYYDANDNTDLNWAGIDLRLAFNVGWRF